MNVIKQKISVLTIWIVIRTISRYFGKVNDKASLLKR